MPNRQTCEPIFLENREQSSEFICSRNDSFVGKFFEGVSLVLRDPIVQIILPRTRDKMKMEMLWDADVVRRHERPIVLY